VPIRWLGDIHVFGYNPRKLVPLHHHGSGPPLDLLVLVLVQGQSALRKRCIQISGQLGLILRNTGHGHNIGGGVALPVGVALREKYKILIRYISFININTILKGKTRT